MDLVSILKVVFGGFNLLEIIAIFIVSIAIIIMLLTSSIITQITNISGIFIIACVFIFSTVLVKGGYFFFQDTIKKSTDKKYLTNNIFGEEEKNIVKRSSLDDGKDIVHYSLDKPLGRMKYSEAEVKNSLDKIYKTYGLETIYYMQDVLLKAQRLQGSDEAIYVKLEDYAFICSMNICNKYLYDFNDVKKNLGGAYLVVVVPEFLYTLENYVP